MKSAIALKFSVTAGLLTAGIQKIVRFESGLRSPYLPIDSLDDFDSYLQHNDNYYHSDGKLMQANSAKILTQTLLLFEFFGYNLNTCSYVYCN